MMKFSERFCEALENSRYSQKELAQMLHIAEANITNWKTGKNFPLLETFYNLCNVLDVSADYLLGL